MRKALIGLAPLLLAACVTVTAPDGAQPQGAGLCRAEAAQSLTGQIASSKTGARALALTGARALRWGPPDSAWTMDYRQDRVNVRYDRDMRITEISCG